MELKGTTVRSMDTEPQLGLDIITLQDGRVLGITKEGVCLYKSSIELWAGTPEDKPMLDLTQVKHQVKITQLVKMTYDIEIVGELTAENIRKQFDENYSYPDADTMVEFNAHAWANETMTRLPDNKQTY